MGLLFSKGSGNCLPSWMRSPVNTDSFEPLVQPASRLDRALDPDRTIQLTRAGLPLRSPGASLDSLPRLA
jgi:hypothetical protein